MKSDTRALVAALAARVLEGPGEATQGQRRAAFDNKGVEEPLASFMSRVALEPTRVTDRDFAAAASAGLSDDQLFELVICAAVGQASRQYEAAIAALDAAADGGEGGGSHAT